MEYPLFNVSILSNDCRIDSGISLHSSDVDQVSLTSKPCSVKWSRIFANASSSTINTSPNDVMSS